jgi:hypothetical protein
MPRPAKGEGERPKFIRKGSQALLVTLIVATPLCMAQEALASTSAFLKPSATSSIGGKQFPALLGTQRTSQGTLQSTGLLGLGGKQSPFRLLTSDDINTLESTLATYKSQLATLKATTPKNPANASSLNTAISNVETKISNLEDAIATAKTAYAKQLNAQETLRRALSQYNSAVEAEAQAKLKAESDAANYQTVLQTLQQAQTAYDASLTRLNEAISAKDSAQNAYDIADASLTRQIGITNEALTNLNDKKSSRASAEQALVLAQQEYNLASSNLSLKQVDRDNALLALQQAQDAYDNSSIPDPTWTAPTHQVAHTRQVPHTETVYTTTLVPHTETVAHTETIQHTEYVPHTTTTLQEQVIPNLLNNSDFSQGNSGWSGLSIGWQNSVPGYFNGNIVFSYTNQTVSQGLYSGPFQNATLTLSADWYNNDSNRNITDSYSMKVEAWDIDHNPVGTATYNSTGRHDWETKSVTLNPTGSVSYITVSFSGIDNGYWAGDYGPHLKNPSLMVSYGQLITETTYEEVITYEEVTTYEDVTTYEEVTTSEEVTTYTTETYYTTEVIQPQTGLTVKVYNNLNSSNPQRSDTAYNLCKTTTLTSINHNWGGGDILGCGGDRVMIHYTGYLTPTENVTSLMGQADDGFFMSLNGNTVINNWTLKGCGGNWNPVSLEAGKTYEIDAWFFEWGGGACSILNYQSNNGSGVVPESWYTNAISAPMIKNPDLLPAIAEAQVNYDDASEIYNITLTDVQTKTNLLSSAQDVRDQSISEEATAQSVYDSAVVEQNGVSQVKADAESNLSTKVTEQSSVESSHQTVSTQLAEATTTEATAKQVVTEATELHAQAQSVTQTTLASKAEAETKVQVSESVTQEAYVKADAEIKLVSFTDVETIVNEPAPPPPPVEEEGSKEIPAELSAENLMSVDLTAVDPTELTEAQAEQLVEAALETFLTAEEGSPEYEQALDALYLAAEQDDIELSPELAAIPGLAGAVELLNFFGNAGADMSPKVREESKKVVVTAVVATGAAVQAAAGAAASATASSGSGSSGGSSSSRRKIGK